MLYVLLFVAVVAIDYSLHHGLWSGSHEES